MRGLCVSGVKRRIKRVLPLLVFIAVLIYSGNFLETFVHDKKTDGTIIDNLVGASNLNRGIRLEWPEDDDQALGIYILTVIGSNTTRYSGYERDIKLTGWWSTKHYNISIKCCLLWPNKTLSEFENPTVEKRSPSTKYVATQIDCPINARFSDVDGVALQFAGMKCPTDDKMYTKPVIPIKPEEDESFAVCLKIVYGTVNNRNLIDYLEFLRVMKVDKVFMFSFNVTEDSNAVIEHYVKLGLVDRRPYNYPFNSTTINMISDLCGTGIIILWQLLHGFMCFVQHRTDRKKYIGASSRYRACLKGRLSEKRLSVYEDQRVPLLDCVQRSSGYKYMAVIDMDEYLVPQYHDNYKELMKYIMRTHPNAAGFKFESFLFPKDFGPDLNAPANGSDIVKYFRRTQALTGMTGRNKILFLPTRIMTRGYYTHSFRPINDYEKLHLNNSIAAIYHYRKCYSDIRSICSGNLTEDKSILKFVEKFKNKGFSVNDNWNKFGSYLPL